MINPFGKRIYNFSRKSRHYLLSVEAYLAETKKDKEDYVRELLIKHNIKLKFKVIKNTNTPDDGVDFVIEFGEENPIIFVSQLKWHRYEIGFKAIKQIFGELYLSELYQGLINSNLQVKFIIFAPLVTQSVIYKKELLNSLGITLVSGDDFVKFLSNPYYSLQQVYEEVV